MVLYVRKYAYTTDNSIITLSYSFTSLPFVEAWYLTSHPHFCESKELMCFMYDMYTYRKQIHVKLSIL